MRRRCVCQLFWWHLGFSNIIVMDNYGLVVPQDELKKFLSKADKITAGEEVVPEEDFEAKKLDASNLGMQMLQKAGWKEGEGLGAGKQGIAAPVNMTATVADSAG